MKARKRFIAISLFFVCLASRAAFAVPTTPAQAENVVRGWLIYDSSPFGKLAGEFSKVESYGESGKTSDPSEALYYAVHLDPSGIVLLPADDELNPITAYASDADWYGPEPANPLYDTIGASIAEMVKVHRGGKRRGSGVSEARERWATFQDLALSGAKRGDPLAGEPSTVIVGPLLSTTWNQKGQIEEGSEISYNEYTPNNYPAGCGAVMMAQIMKHFGYPTAAISDLTGDKEFYYTVGGQPKSSKLMGGNGNGEPYDISGPTADQIARLIADCAVAIGSDFAKDATGSNPALIAESLVNTFRYGNAVLAMPDPSDDKWKDSALEKALNANLDAHKPVGLGIFKSDVADGDPGHGVVADGYGYSGGKICYHINMGWGGDGDVWYDLPGILEYDLIKSVIYNIYSRSAGEIISGKLATSSDVTVTMASTSVGSKGAYVSIEGVGFSSSVWIGNDDGNFVFVGVPSDTEFTITAKLAGHSFPRKTVRTGRSGATATTVGNVWGVIIKEPLYSGESPFGGGGCDAAALPALFAAVGAGVVLFVRKKR